MQCAVPMGMPPSDSPSLAAAIAAFINSTSAAALDSSDMMLLIETVLMLTQE